MERDIMIRQDVIDLFRLKDHGPGWAQTEELTEVFTGSDRAAAKRAFDAMMNMKRIDIAGIIAAVKG